MCIKSAPYLHQKTIALVLMLLTKLAPNCTFKRCSFGMNLFHYDAKIALNIKHFLHLFRKVMQIRCLKDADTKMHNCLVG